MNDAPTADNWRAQITALCGGDTIEAMLAWAARQGGSVNKFRRHRWTAKVGWFGYSCFYQAVVYQSATGRTTEREHPTDPAEALALALIAAVEMGEGRE